MYHTAPNHPEATPYHHPHAGRRHRLLQPWVLLLLLQKPSHGYELMERLSEGEKTPSADPGLLYRTLHRLEEDGMVHSSWDTTGKGPARRLYQVTPEGVEYLRAWTVNVRSLRSRLDYFLSEYEALFPDEERAEIKHPYPDEVNPK